MEETTIKRIMPHSTEAEQSVIGALLTDNQAISVIEGILSPDDFYNRQYGIIFGAMVELVNEGRPVDVLTLQQRLTEKGVPPEISNLTYIGELVANVPITDNAKYYADIVKEKSVLRRMIHAAEDVATNCYGGADKLEDILGAAETRFYEVINQRGVQDYVPISQIALDVLDRIEEASRTKNPITGVPTGFPDLDIKTAGFHPGDLILIAARPSMGKTALALNMAQYACFKKDLPVVIFSLEMSKEQLVNRMFAMESLVDASKIRIGDLNDDEWGKLCESAHTVGQSKLIIDDTARSVPEIRTKCRRYKADQNIQMIVIDYLQFVESGKHIDNRTLEIGDITRSLKMLARELGVPIVLLSQLSRGVETRQDKRPLPSDLRESGSIEQDADVILFIYRDDYYNKDSDKKNIAEIIIAKQRNGPTGMVELGWMPNYTKFVSLEHRKEQ
ncbi:MAG: replicative DNA helicase [Lachnospiraceae bacterium]|nr:replicative DNA helicase [Candidatus Minthocola equi]